MSDFLTDGRNPFQLLLTRLFPPLALLGGCDDGGSSSQGCIEGETQSCMCAGADDMGVQVCEADGTWGECDCGDSDTDTDVDTDLSKLISVGLSHACAVTSEGAAKCWGENYDGELGDGTYEGNPFKAVDVYGLDEGVKGITARGSAEGSFACAVTAEGGVKCWGANDYGQLGDGTLDESSPTPVSVIGLDSGVTYVESAMRGGVTCAVTSSGGLKCWGLDGETPIPSDLPVSDVLSVSGGDSHDPCVLLSSGAVECLIYPITEGDTIPIAGLESDVVQISVGYVGIEDDSTGNNTYEPTGCALMIDGAVKCWEWDAWDSPTEAEVVQGLESGVIQVSVGYSHACALMSDGAAKCWGYNEEGQLGGGTMEISPTPVDVTALDDTIAAISAGGWTTCALTPEDKVKCWGLLGETECLSAVEIDDF